MHRNLTIAMTMAALFVCSGLGCEALQRLSEHPDTMGYVSDIGEGALEVAVSPFALGGWLKIVGAVSALVAVGAGWKVNQKRKAAKAEIVIEDPTVLPAAPDSEALPS